MLVEMGNHVACDYCDFEITFGHSLDLSQSTALCTNCLARYAIPTVNRFGADVGDRLERHKITVTKEHKLGVLTATSVLFTVSASDRDGCVIYPLKVVYCPECNCNSLVGHLNNGDKCPACFDGSLTAQFVEI